MARLQPLSCCKIRRSLEQRRNGKRIGSAQGSALVAAHSLKTTDAPVFAVSQKWKRYLVMRGIGRIRTHIKRKGKELTNVDIRGVVAESSEDKDNRTQFG